VQCDPFKFFLLTVAYYTEYLLALAFLARGHKAHCVTVNKSYLHRDIAALAIFLGSQPEAVAYGRSAYDNMKLWISLLPAVIKRISLFVTPPTRQHTTVLLPFREITKCGFERLFGLMPG